MDLKSITGTLALVAPMIATALGGPLAGMAVRTISGILLGKETGTEQEVAQALTSATPDQLLSLKKADQDFAAKMQELGIDLERLHQQDRASARQMQVEVRSWTPPLLAGMITLGFFGILGYMVHFGLPKSAGGEALLILLGSLGTAWVAVVQFFFGSSASSQRKDSTIDRMANGR